MAMILITHDLGVVAGRTDEVAVMYAAASSNARRPRRCFKKMRNALHRGAAGGDPEDRRRSAHALAGDIRTTAGPDQADPGLLVFAALPLRCRPMSSREALARRGGIARPPYACFHPIEVAAGATA